MYKGELYSRREIRTEFKKIKIKKINQIARETRDEREEEEERKRSGLRQGSDKNSISGGWSPQPSALNLICGLGQTVWKVLYYKKIGENIFNREQ